MLQTLLTFLVLVGASGAASAGISNCDRGLLTRVRTEGLDVKQIGPLPSFGQYALEINDRKQESIKVVEIIDGKRHEVEVPANIIGGVYKADYATKNNGKNSAISINFDIYSKKALIIYTLTKGKVSIRSTFDGYCE